MKKARAVLRWVRHAPDRLLHPLRRRAAIGRVRRARPRSILSLCHGNICRSPYAEKALQAALPVPLRAAFEISSAGFFGPDRPSPDEAIRVAANHGVDLAEHRSRLVSPELLREADLVLVMNRAQRAEVSHVAGRTALLLGDFDPLPIETRTIRDPVEQPESVFDEVYARIDRCVCAVARSLQVS